MLMFFMFSEILQFCNDVVLSKFTKLEKGKCFICTDKVFVSALYQLTWQNQVKVHFVGYPYLVGAAHCQADHYCPPVSWCCCWHLAYSDPSCQGSPRLLLWDLVHLRILLPGSRPILLLLPAKKSVLKFFGSFKYYTIYLNRYL